MPSSVSDKLVQDLCKQHNMAGVEVYTFTKTGIDSLVDIVAYGCLTEVFADSSDAYEVTNKIRERIKAKYGLT